MKRLFTSCFGLGHLPLAPGKWASVPVAVIFGLLCWFDAGLALTSAVMAFTIGFFSTVCVRFGPEVIKTVGKKDPREIVADEVAGQAVTFIGAYAAGLHGIVITAAIGFVAFRVFDVIKPWPCRKLENCLCTSPLFLKKGPYFHDPVEEIENAIIHDNLTTGTNLLLECIFGKTIENNFLSRCNALHGLEQKGLIDIKLDSGKGTLVRSTNSDYVIKNAEMD